MQNIDKLRAAARFAGLRGREVNDFVIRMQNAQIALREEKARENESK